MSKGQNIDIQTDPKHPFPSKGSDVGHITGTPRQDPPKADGISVWPSR